MQFYDTMCDIFAHRKTTNLLELGNSKNSQNRVGKNKAFFKKNNEKFCQFYVLIKYE
jgi:hypothetical protein